MNVEELIEYLQKLPRDFEIFVSTYQNFGNPHNCKKTKEVIAEMSSESVTIIYE